MATIYQDTASARGALSSIGPAVIALSALALACSSTSPFGTEPRCYPPTSGFSETTIVGTWKAGVPDQQDTLVIRRDGTYKQSIHVDFAEASPTDYEGQWQPWQLEYSADGIPYLHLKGYRFCGMNPSIPCQVTDGDGYDVCRDETIPMQGEGILLVLGTNTKETGPNDEVFYYLHYPLGSEDSWVYIRQGP